MGEDNASPNLYKRSMEKYVHIELHGDCNHDYISGFNVCIIEGLETNISSFVNAKGYVPKQGDMIYLLPGVNIPRVKLKDLALNLGIRVVRDPEKANVIFSGKSTLGKMTTSNWYYMADADTIFENVKTIAKDDYYIEKLETALAASGATKICSDWSDMRNSLCRGNTDIYDSTYVYGIEPEYQEAYDAIQGKDVYDESELIANINGDDSTVIDEEVFQQLKNMFESSDNDNHVLAMEIMANSHYEKSVLYLQMLLSNYSYQISNSHTKNHVNFKSMLSYFNWGPRNLGTRSAEQIIKIIDEKGLLTVDMIKRLFVEYTHSIYGNINYDNVFEIKEVTIKQEYLDKLNLSSLNLINPEEEENLEITDPVDEIVTDELIEAALTNINRKELKSELIELEKSEEDLAHELYGVDNDNIEASFKVQPESNNNQIEETNGGNDLDWF
jgi:hypothetical protein